MEKAGELLSMLELVGIVRDKAKEVVIDKDTLDFYSAQSEHLNNDFHIGETVVVTRPCWKINGHPARKATKGVTEVSHYAVYNGDTEKKAKKQLAIEASIEQAMKNDILQFLEQREK